MTLPQAKNKLTIGLAKIYAEHEAKHLLFAATGIPEAEQPLKFTYELTPAEEIILQDLLNRRLSGEPLQYILGEWDFYGLTLEVGKGVLIPRQDTEILAEKALFHLNKTDATKVLDLCCGSGCIGIALAVNCEVAVTAADVSETALEYTRRNAARHGVNINTVKSDMFESITGRYDLIVSNPPYIPAGDIRKLDSTVKDHEPSMALDGGRDGLDFYKVIAKSARDFLTPGGAVMVEVGIGQSLAVGTLLARAGFGRLEFFDDYSGICRVVSCRLPI